MRLTVLGANIRRCRTERNMTQPTLAKRLKQRQPSVSEYERGVRPPTLEVFLKIARVLGVDLSELLRGV